MRSYPVKYPGPTGVFGDSNDAGGSDRDGDPEYHIIPGQQKDRNTNLDRDEQRPAQTDYHEGARAGDDPESHGHRLEPRSGAIDADDFLVRRCVTENDRLDGCTEMDAGAPERRSDSADVAGMAHGNSGGHDGEPRMNTGAFRNLDKRCVSFSDRNEPPAGTGTGAPNRREKRPNVPSMTLRSSGGNGGGPEAPPGAVSNLTKRPVTVFDRNRPTRKAAMESGLSGVTGGSRASGGRYQEVSNDSRPPVRLIRDLFNPDELNGKYWSTTDPTAEAHITESYPYLDWKLILKHADEPYVPDTPLETAGTVAFVYAAVAEANKPTASEDLRTEKEAFPDDAGKVPVNDMRIPGSFDEAIYKSPQKEYWKAATKVEINAQINNQTVVEVPIGNLPNDINLIDGTWKFDAKADPETGLVRRYKARFCGRGDMQVAGVDYHETSSPVVSYTTLRIILALACTYKAACILLVV